jgi:hypothetical protein
MRADERGAVTAEAAVVLPVLVLVALGLAWVVALGVAEVRVADAAREAARALARGDPEAQGATLARQVAPGGARVLVTHGDGLVRVRVSAPVPGPGGVLGFLPSFTASADAVAAEEQQ